MPALTAEEQLARSLVPVRNPNYPGPIAMEFVAEKLRAQGRKLQNPLSGTEKYEIDAFIDGSLSVLEIRDAVSAECGPIRIADMLDYMKVLADAGLISYRGK